MKDKAALLMEETGCDRSEAELALELCGYDLETAVQAVPRLFQNISVFKGRLQVRCESLYGLWLVILDLKARALLRARAVVSYNPAVFATDLSQHWFDFEARLYACRLWAGTTQDYSQEVEALLTGYFGSGEASQFYKEGVTFRDRDFERLRSALRARLRGAVELETHQDVLDMGQFKELRPRSEESLAAHARRSRSRRQPGEAPGHLVLQVSVDPDSQGVPAAELGAGDMVYASINDTRDIAQYLARLFGARAEGKPRSRGLLVPIEAIEKNEGGDVTIRVRFSAGVCGDVTLPGDIRLKAVPRTSKTPWWRKLFGG